MTERKAFVFDTNFIIENKKRLDEVLKNLSADFNVYVTQVSIDERIAQNCRDAKEKFDEIEDSIKKYSDIADIHIRKTFDEVCNFYYSDTPKAYRIIFGNNIIPYDKNTEMFLTVLDRAYKKTPPFPLNEKSDHGFKDTVLWLSLIKYFKNNGEKEIVFVTEDKGFIKNKEKLIAEFKEETDKLIEIMPNSYYEELLHSDKDEQSANKTKPLPDFSLLRDRIQKTINDLCFVDTVDYWGNETQESIFLITKKVDVFDIELFFIGLEKTIRDNILENTVLTEEVFAALDNFSPAMHHVSIDTLEQALRLYEEIIEQYPEFLYQFFSAVANIFNRNYVESDEDNIVDDDLPF